LETDHQITPEENFSEMERENMRQNAIAEYGNEIDEIISKRPPFIVRWGIVLLFIMLLFIGILSWFIKYPDIITASAKLTSINAPKEVITKTSGKLIKLFAKEGEQANAGAVLGYMESNASHQEITYLGENLEKMEAILQKDALGALLPYLDDSYQHLGELQQSYQVFLQSFIGFRNYIANGFYLKKEGMLAKDAALLRILHDNLIQPRELNIEDLDLSQKTFAANESLHKDKVIADLEHRVEKSKLINKKLTLPQINAAITSNEAQHNEKQKEIAELKNTISQQKAVFYQSLYTFKSELDGWKQKYFLIAPVAGKISFGSFIQENQQLQTNQVICYINPGNSEYYAELYVPQANLGKVKLGQEVLIKFPSYPFQEYGSVKGKIDFISNIPTDSGYLAKLSLPNALTTSYQKEVQFREGLQAQGEIITQNMRLLQRFYYNIIKQVDGNE
jgi:HlyD family secretion protein